MVQTGAFPRRTNVDLIRYRGGMQTTPANPERETESTSVPALPEAAIAGDWTILAAIAAAVAALLIWHRRNRRDRTHL